MSNNVKHRAELLPPSPVDILALPGRLLPPLRLVSWAIFGTKNASNLARMYIYLCLIRERLVLVQKHSKSGEDHFF